MWLTVFHIPLATSKTQAAKALHKVHINIFDLLAGAYDMRFATVGKLAAYSYPDYYFPREEAKEAGLRVFLRRIKKSL